MSLWRRNVKLMTAISIIMVAAACSFVTVTTQEDTRPWVISTVTRADTRDFSGMRYVREIDIAYLWSLSQMALPNEVAFCLYGYAADTVIVYKRLGGENHGDSVSLNRKVAVIDSVYIANIEEATPTYVQFKEGIACDPNPRLIGTAHTHPYVPHPQMGGRCSHSDLDVLYAQHRETEFWFTLVLCTWTHELLWADGRRLEYFVQNPNNPLEMPDDHPNINRTDTNGNEG